MGEAPNDKLRLVGKPDFDSTFVPTSAVAKMESSNFRGQFEADQPFQCCSDLLACCGTLDCNFCRCTNCSECLDRFFSCTNYELAFIGFQWLVILGIVRQWIGEGGDTESPYNLTKISGSAVVLAGILIYAIPKWIYKYICKPCC